MTRKEIIFEEASAKHATSFLEFMKLVANETDFLVMDTEILASTDKEIADFFESQIVVADQLVLLAIVDGEVVGAISVRTAEQYYFQHIGDIFIAVKKDFWGQGIATILLEEVVFWAQENGLLKRLELTVQVRNERALALYKKVGFEIEGIKKHGVRLTTGEFVDVYQMGMILP